MVPAEHFQELALRNVYSCAQYRYGFTGIIKKIRDTFRQEAERCPLFLQDYFFVDQATWP